MNQPHALAAPGTTAAAAQRPRAHRVTLLGWTVAGNRTHYQSVRDAALAAPDIKARMYTVQAHREGGLIERLPAPGSIRGHLRSFVEAWPATIGRKTDAVWTSCSTPALPLALRYRALGGPPLVVTMDSTPAQMDLMGGHYGQTRTGAGASVRDAVSALLFRSAAMLNPWSHWAADSLMRDYKVPASKVRVIPPGVDLERWQPGDGAHQRAGRPRLLFVGADFARKGGDLLLDVFRQAFADRCELHLVTREQVPASPGVAVHTNLAPNDPELRALYASADIFVLPTRADCFSLAGIEAMASGLPVITTDTGGIAEIVVHERTGFLIAPGDGVALRQRVETLLQAPERRARMGAAGRARAERHFDGARNARALLDLIIDVAAKNRSAA
jgi:glycosyltransferase involved in cell wall biosynthesis